MEDLLGRRECSNEREYTQATTNQGMAWQTCTQTSHKENKGVEIYLG
jgi:hypothetical protein